MLLPDLLSHYSVNRKRSATTVTEFVLYKARCVSRYIILVKVFENGILDFFFSPNFVTAVISRVRLFDFLRIVPKSSQRKKLKTKIIPDIIFISYLFRFS